MKEAPADETAHEAKLMAQFGEHVLEGATNKERFGNHCGMIMTVMMTGQTSCKSLRDTALNGGC